MIKSKYDYKIYYRTDLIATGLSVKKHLFCYDIRYKYYKNLRLTEYFINCKKGFINKVIKIILLKKHYKLSLKTGWSIPPNVFGKGLAIVHIGTIVVSEKSRIGDFCRIHVGTNIGNAPSHGVDGTPEIGNNVYIGPGVKLFGPIKIGDNVAIGANAVVNKSFPDNCTIAGIPAKIISNNSSKNYIIGI